MLIIPYFCEIIVKIFKIELIKNFKIKRDTISS